MNLITPLSFKIKVLQKITSGNVILHQSGTFPHTDDYHPGFTNLFISPSFIVKYLSNNFFVPHL